MDSTFCCGVHLQIRREVPMATFKAASCVTYPLLLRFPKVLKHHHLAAFHHLPTRVFTNHHHQCIHIKSSQAVVSFCPPPPPFPHPFFLTSFFIPFIHYSIAQIPDLTCRFARTLDLPVGTPLFSNGRPQHWCVSKLCWLSNVSR